MNAVDICWQCVAVLLALTMVANGSPILARLILGDRFSRPLDGEYRLADGHPLLGATKTWRGLFAAVLITELCALLLRLPVGTGALAAGLAMAGDLLASFIKRRLAMPSSSMAPGLDQIPEVLLPAIFLRGQLGLSWLDMLFGVALFTILVPLVSRLLYRVHVRRRPY